MLKATPSPTKHDRCAFCGQLIYRTITARGPEFAHVDSKVLFCTTDPVSARWQDTLRFLVEDCGLDAAGTETMVRLAATIIDEDGPNVNAVHQALISFSEPDEVEHLATSVARRLYPDDQRA